MVDVEIDVDTVERVGANGHVGLSSPMAAMASLFTVRTLALFDKPTTPVAVFVAEYITPGLE